MVLSLPEATTVKFTDIQSLYLTFVQNNKEVLTKQKKDMLTIYEKEMKFALSQKETLTFKNGKARMQLRAKLKNGDAIVQEPITELNFLEILRDGEI